MKEDKTADALKILKQRYLKPDAKTEASLDEERVNAQVAKQIYELRQKEGLSQTALAKLVGTTQSAISRLEDSDYEGHSLSMLHRIAKSLGRKVTIDLLGERSLKIDENNQVKQELIARELAKINKKLSEISKKLEDPQPIP